MRAPVRAATALLVLLPLFAFAACDEEKKPTEANAQTTASQASASAQTTTAASSQATTTALPKGPPMPPRPVPLGSSGPIQPSDPAEKQMMAITYTMAMLTPRGGDQATVDQTYLDGILKKLEVAVRTADTGKTPPNPIKPARGNRKLEINMGKGCTDRVPSMMIQRAGSSLKDAYNAGVLVIACHDDKWECHQSTRDTKDVLCHAAPRH